MSLIWMEGFEGYATGETSTTLENLLKERYSNANTDGGTNKGEIKVSPSPGNMIHFGDASTTDFITLGPFGGGTPPDEIYLSLKIFCDRGIGGSTGIIRCFSSSSQEIVELNMDNTTSWRVMIRSSVDQDHFNAIDFYPKEWNTIELYAKAGNVTAGAYEVRINGTTVSSGTGLDTVAAGNVDIDRIVIQNQGSGSDQGWRLRDIICNDAAGSVNNTWIGEQKHVYNLLPTGDTADEQWALSAGADSFALIDDVSNDGVTTYISSSTATEKTICDYAASGGESNVIAISIHTTAALASAGSETFDDIVAEGTSETDSAAHTVASTSYAMFETIYETNPDTAAAWTSAELDAIQGGVKFN